MFLSDYVCVLLIDLQTLWIYLEIISKANPKVYMAPVS